MANLFKKPYRAVDSSSQKFMTIVVFGLFIFLFLFFFRPFGLTEYKTIPLLFLTFGFGVVTTFMLIIFKYLIEPVVIKNNWTLGKNIIWDLLIASSIGAVNYLYVIIIFHQGFKINYLLYSIFVAILVGVIPVTVTYILRYNRIYKQALKEAAIVPEEILFESEVIIRAGNDKNEFRCNPKNIVYLCSNDNYVTIVTISGDSLNKTTIRGTLKAAESELNKNSRFVRCHKCYIVNLDFTDRIIGHNQNMKIKLLSSGSEIPVSRQKAEEIIKKTKRG